jgi:hypothetical protein
MSARTDLDDMKTLNLTDAEIQLLLVALLVLDRVDHVIRRPDDHDATVALIEKLGKV